MTTTAEPPFFGLDRDAKVRCSDWARASSLSPAGTAGTYPGYLLVEIPLPWPHDVGETAQAAVVAPVIAPAGYRLQAVMPVDPDTPAESRRVILHARAPGAPGDLGDPGFAGYRRFETTAGPSLPDTVAALVAAAADPAPSSLEAPAVDVLVCGHGRRDACCGRLGAGLAVRLAAPGPRAGVNLWRTSHLGGHRFAPVALVLPQGTGWAFADLGLVDAVLSREGDFAAVADRYRGCSGLDSPQVQALEVEVLRREGWRVLDRPRGGSFDGSVAELTFQEDDGRTVTWSGSVQPGRTVPTPDCLQPPASARKSQTEWAVSAVVRREQARLT